MKGDNNYLKAPMATGFQREKWNLYFDSTCVFIMADIYKATLFVLPEITSSYSNRPHGNIKTKIK